MTIRKYLIVFAITILCLFLYASCASLQPAHSAYIVPESQIKADNWDDFFESEPLIDSFIILNTGSVKVPLKGMLNIEKLGKNHDFEEYLWVDVFAYLFHHTSQGWFMIDTGLDSTFQKKGNIVGMYASHYIKASRQDSKQNIGSQLSQKSVQIGGIFFTHLHGDHSAGLPEIDPSVPKYVGKNEKFFNIPFVYHSNHLSKTDTLFDIDWEKGMKLYPFESVIDIFGDGSLLGIHTPGHSIGHLSFLLGTKQGHILLTGDASHTKYGFRNGIEPGWVDDQIQAEKSLSQLIEFVKMFPNIDVIYGHELDGPDFTNKYSSFE